MEPKKTNAVLKIAACAFLLGAMCLAAVSCGRSSSGDNGTPTVYSVNRYDHPTDITASADGTKLYVANNVRNTVTIYDPNTMGVLADIPVSCLPRHLVESPDGSTLVVGHDTTQGCKFSPLGPGGASEYDQTTGVWNGFEGTKLSYIDLTQKKVVSEFNPNANDDNRRLMETRELYWDSASDKLYGLFYSFGRVGVFDGTAATYTTRIEDITSPISLDLASDGKTMVITNVTENKLHLVDITTDTQYTNSPWNSFFSFTSPAYVVCSDSNPYCFVSNYASSSIVIVDVSGAGSAWDEAMKIGEIDLKAGSSGQAYKPSVMALSSDEEWLVVANTYSNDIYAIPWGTMKTGAATVMAYVFKVSDSTSDLAIIGDYVYVADQQTSQIYKLKFKDPTRADSIKTLAASQFAAFPY